MNAFRDVDSNFSVLTIDKFSLVCKQLCTCCKKNVLGYDVKSSSHCFRLFMLLRMKVNEK